MQKLVVFVSIILAISASHSLCWGNSDASTQNIITIKGGMLSIDARDISPENVLKELGKTCGIEMVINSNSIPDVLISIRYKDVELVEGIKGIIKGIGVKNYMVQYKKIGNKNCISRIEFIGSTIDSKGLTSTKEEKIRQTMIVPEEQYQENNTTSSVAHYEENKDDKNH